jgi:hypothetical protein
LIGLMPLLRFGMIVGEQTMLNGTAVPEGLTGNVE